MAESGEPLTEREREIIRLVATGATNRMIAHRLSISPNTVKVHLRNTFTKLDISSRTEATVIAIREGWVDVPAGQPDPALRLEEAVAEAKEAPPPLPWEQRIYLVASALVVIAFSALTWPRPGSAPDESCTNEFTAECPAEASALEMDEPESLWVSGAALPEARGRFALVTYQGRLYVIGGETPEGVAGSVLVYDPREDAWSSAADKPTPAANLSAAVLGDRIYAVGGGGEQGRPLDVMEVYDPAADQWSEGVSLPTPLAAHTAAAAKDKLYLFGGWNGTSYTADALAYDPVAGRWERLPLLPTPRGFAGSAVVRDQLLVVGGYDGQRELALCERFDLGREEWERCPAMSTPRGGAGVAAVAGQVYVIGGGWESFVTFSERYNPGSETWFNVETPLLLTGGEWRNLGVTAVGTRVYAVGGWQRGRYLTVNQAYETLPNRLYLPAASGQ